MRHTQTVDIPRHGSAAQREQTARTPVVRVPPSAEPARDQTDHLAVEEPLEIRLGFGPLKRRRRQPLAITMRTPGDDEELALGFLFTEGIVGAPDEVRSIGPCAEDASANVIRAELAPGATFDPERLKRHFYTTSSCGVCGKQSLEALRAQGRFNVRDSNFRIAEENLHLLPRRLLEIQRTFARTGGLHAAALFDRAGVIGPVREDVGRHNALDKLIGRALIDDQIPLHHRGILVSGRASFELMQKAMMAGCPMLVAIGAPSSLAVSTAREFGITLVGFLRERRFNIYTGRTRVIVERRA